MFFIDVRFKLGQRFQNTSRAPRALRRPGELSEPKGKCVAQHRGFSISKFTNYRQLIHGKLSNRSVARLDEPAFARTDVEHDEEAGVRCHGVSEARRAGEVAYEEEGSGRKVAAALAA